MKVLRLQICSLDILILNLDVCIFKYLFLSPLIENHEIEIGKNSKDIVIYLSVLLVKSSSSLLFFKHFFSKPLYKAAFKDFSEFKLWIRIPLWVSQLTESVLEISPGKNVSEMSGSTRN